MIRANEEAVTFEDEDGEANVLSPEFATATMGHVLLGQGQRDAAREVFRAVLAKDPGDAEAARGMRLLGEPVSHGAPVGASAVAHAVDATTVYARWSVGPTGEGELQTLVIVSLWVEGPTLRRDEREEATAPGAGESFVRGLRPGAAHHLAVGVRSPSGFAPLVTMGPVLTPGASPSQRVATELSPVGRRPEPSLFEEALDAWQRTVMPTS
jgi:hypothetical protein